MRILSSTTIRQSPSRATDSIPLKSIACSGSSIAKGLVKSGAAAKTITLTRRKPESLAAFKKAGFQITDDNTLAVKECKIILMSVGPSQLMDLLDDISPHLTKDHLLISIVSGIEIITIQEKVGTETPLRSNFKLERGGI